MQQVKDYAGFAVRFTGLAYVVVYALTAPEWGAPLASLLTVSLPPGLHLIGAVAAALVVVESALAAVRSWRKVPSVPDALVAAPGRPVSTGANATRQVPLRARAPLPPQVKPRQAFGLRGMPPPNPPRRPA